MARRVTRQIKYVRLPEKRIREIDDLVAKWPYETRAFMRARMNQYKPRTGFINFLVDRFLFLVVGDHDKHFEIINDPDVITDWQTRFEISGQRNPQDAWNKILDKEITARDHLYLISLLDRKLRDVHVPYELKSLFQKNLPRTSPQRIPVRSRNSQISLSSGCRIQRQREERYGGEGHRRRYLRE